MAATQTKSPLENKTLAGQAGQGHLPEVIVFENDNFEGEEYRTNLAVVSSDFWNDKISSIVVVSGTWRFWENVNFQGRHFDLGPGYYASVSQATGDPWWNDRISSWEPIACSASKDERQGVSLMAQLPAAFEHFNEVHPHSFLKMRFPREFRRHDAPGSCSRQFSSRGDAATSSIRTRSRPPSSTR